MKTLQALTVVGGLALGVWIWDVLLPFALEEAPAAIQSNAALQPIGSFIIDNPILPSEPGSGIYSSVWDWLILLLGMIALLAASFWPQETIRAFAEVV